MKFSINVWFAIAALLCIPAFLINLDLITLNEDEAIRALVALEMKLSGDFITPTLNGSLYYAKPPLYNWLLNISYMLFGNYSHWALRTPTLFFLILFCTSIFYYSSIYFDRRYAFVNVMLFLTCGRVLFWDSMLGYIDICYSWITFMNLMVIFHCFQKNQLLKLFLFSYALTGIGFLLKGFPSLIFQGITLLVFFSYKKEFKKLFSKYHFIGIGVFLLIILSYYGIYFYHNPENSAFEGLLDQSTRRTLFHDRHGLGDFLLHIVFYPFENIYHFFPWSIMFIYFFRRDLFKILWQNEFLKYCAIIFMANILVYWVSIEVYPRYILMLIPLIFSLFLHFHRTHYDDESFLYKVFIGFALIVMLFGASITISFLFWPEISEVPYGISKAISIALVLFFLMYYFYKNKSQRLIVFSCSLLIVRIGFNFFVLPDRYEHDPATLYKQQAISVGEKYMNDDLRLYKYSKLDYTSSFYLASTRNKITQRDFDPSSVDAFYILDETRYEFPEGFEEVESFQNREADKVLKIIKKTD